MKLCWIGLHSWEDLYRTWQNVPLPGSPLSVSVTMHFRKCHHCGKLQKWQGTVFQGQWITADPSLLTAEHIKLHQV